MKLTSEDKNDLLQLAAHINLSVTLMALTIIESQNSKSQFTAKDVCEELDRARAAFDLLKDNFQNDWF